MLNDMHGEESGEDNKAWKYTSSIYIYDNNNFINTSKVITVNWTSYI